MKQYFEFHGYASRKDVWAVFGVYVLLYVVCVAGWASMGHSSGLAGLVLVLATFVLTVLALAGLVATISRRLLTVGRSRANLLFMLIPLTGLILIVACGCWKDRDGR